MQPVLSYTLITLQQHNWTSLNTKYVPTITTATSNMYMTRAQGSRVQDEASVFKSLLPNHPVIPKKGPGPASYKPKPTYVYKVKTKNPRIKFLP